MEKLNYVIECSNIHKKFKNFELDIPSLRIPQGFATALIGENGAGKTTLLNILSGIRLDYKGEILYFGQYNDKDREENPIVKEQIGYTGPGGYYLPQWSIRQISEISSILFDGFHPDRFNFWCRDLDIDSADSAKSVSTLSDGNRMKLMIAGVLARDTSLLLMDEPASPLDPLMRSRLCEIIRDYLLEDEGNRSVFFSTHNIADMENVTDYAIILLELIADHWIFEGICGKDSPRIEYLQTSGKGEQAICNALIGDLLRRFIWMMVYACVIFALTGQIRTFSSTLSIYIVITAMLNLIRYVKTATYQQLLAFFSAFIYFLCEMSFTIANYTDDGYAPAARWAPPLLAVIAVIVSILTLRHMMFHIKENRYCMKRSLPEHLLHRERKETL